MAIKLLCLCLLLALLGPIWAKKQPCLASASSCDQCIQSSPECAWCTAPGLSSRCQTSRGLRRAGCRKSHIYSPQGEVKVEHSRGPADVVSALQPEKLYLRLRPGVKMSFPLMVTVQKGQPVPELSADTSNVPGGLNITFMATKTGPPAQVQVYVEAARCPSDDEMGPWSVSITPKGFSMSTTLEITFECQCGCVGIREENSAACSGRGALMCGRCDCYNSFSGKECQRESGSLVSPNEDYCRSDPDALVCSGRGLCVEGFCECERRINPAEIYSGRYCECSNFDCERSNNKICAGHGLCTCGECLCDEGWTGEDCSCSMDVNSCMATNQKVCNDRGMCQCGTCVCMPPYADPTCESCPTCQDTCMQHMECVQCRAFGMGTKKDSCDQDCGHISVEMVETTEELLKTENGAKICKMRDENDCSFYYTAPSSSGGQTTVARSKECPRGL
ncbi:integrin beta-1-like isoform X2 [Cynoglossus semilaevis]|uniref:integrin beta-1-like isoform X2 n=1 Tax=Cynoglossus semilaevis TaxID=244447 RepID=UPI0007DC933D|nr:integrin beta-1-like isoform X2 [Cynoglossus semilaevis]